MSNDESEDLIIWVVYTRVPIIDPHKHTGNSTANSAKESKFLTDLAWIPFWPVDNAKLNNSHDNFVPVFNGRFIVDLKEMKMLSVFDNSPPRQVEKSFAFCSTSPISIDFHHNNSLDFFTNLSWIPLNISDADKIKTGLINFKKWMKDEETPNINESDYIIIKSSLINGKVVIRGDRKENNIIDFNIYLRPIEKSTSWLYICLNDFPYWPIKFRPEKLNISVSLDEYFVIDGEIKYVDYHKIISPSDFLSRRICPIESFQIQKLRHIFFIVHGIGENIYAGDEGDKYSAIRFNCHLNDLRHLLNNDKTIDRIEVLPVEWNLIELNKLSILNDISLKSLPKLRSFTNLALSDVLLYANEITRKKVMKQVKKHLILNLIKLDLLVAREIDKLADFINFENSESQSSSENVKYSCNLSKLRKLYESGNISISCIGHSLGSVIFYDVLSSIKLPIKFDNFISLGSPLGLFISLREEEDCLSKLSHIYENNAVNVFNLFHPIDYVAYRIEPLIVKGLREVDPQIVPHEGGHRFHVYVSERLFGNKNIENTHCEELFKKTKTNKRIDWVLQTTITEATISNEYITALSAHFSYWTHEDVWSIILTNCDECRGLRRQKFEEQLKFL